jgi:hypothetical protein
VTLGVVESMSAEEFSGWVEYFVFKAKAEADAVKKAKAKTKGRRGS